MVTLPMPRGELSAALIEALADPVHPISPVPARIAGDPLTDEDLQLALYLCYELHYRGLPGVDDAWEWEPSLLAQRAELERELEGALRDSVPAPERRVAAPEISLAARQISESD